MQEMFEEDRGLIPGLRRSPGEENVDPLQYPCLGNPMDRGAWWATVHRVAKESDMTERASTHHRYAQSWGTADVSPIGHQTWAIWRCPSGSSHKTQGSRGV